MATWHMEKGAGRCNIEYVTNLLPITENCAEIDPAAKIQGKVHGLEYSLLAMTTVSVIMPVYNGERYIAEAIESVLRQTHQDFEFIIVNDGSTDRTPKIIDHYASRDRRVRVIHQPNIGQPATLNRALAEAENDWVAILDADDVWMPERLEVQLRTVRREPSVRVLGSYAIQIDEQGQELGLRTAFPISLQEYREISNTDETVTFVHPSVMMHRPTILALGGYDVAFGPAADSELWSRVSDQHVVMSLPEPLIYYRVHPTSMSATHFFEQRLMLRWLRARQHARRRGLRQPTLKEYQDAHGRSIFHRIDHLRKDWGQRLRADSRMTWRRRHRLRALLMRAAALILDPYP